MADKMTDEAALAAINYAAEVLTEYAIGKGLDKSKAAMGLDKARAHIAARLAATPEETEQSVKADAYDMCAEALAKAGRLAPGGSVVDTVCRLAATAAGVTEARLEAAAKAIYRNDPDQDADWDGESEFLHNIYLTMARAALEAALANQTKKD